MADAQPERRARDYEEEMSDSEGHTPNDSKNSANGLSLPVPATDRYGFLGGRQFTDPEEDKRVPPEILRKREIKWLDMFENWEKWMSKRFKKVKDRCRKGIPPAVRARAWQYLCGGKFQMELNPGKYEEYLRQTGDPKNLDDITKDLHRQFPNHEMFLSKGGYGQTDLFCVLKAYTLHNPQDGYCQAQAPIAAVLLMHMPAEQAFWCLVAICDKYVTGYFSPGLEAIQLDGEVLFGLVKKTSPAIYKHLKKQSVDPIMYMTEWFMCLFTRNLSWGCVLRLWDIFFCEGVKVLFRTALLVLRTVLGTSEKLAECPSFYETLEKLRLRQMPPELLDEEYITREALRINLTDRDMAREHQKQILRRRSTKEKGGKSDKKKKT
ncbi:TBC1 domain family member 10A-like [Babylonia areolata]|uniref:TBC1 domain family member 10A-like n=1 Tax=Babylonia areolata TaxID=304850 RepID=UPI003FD2DAF1